MFYVTNLIWHSYMRRLHIPKGQCQHFRVLCQSLVILVTPLVLFFYRRRNVNSNPIIPESTFAIALRPLCELSTFSVLHALS